MPQVEKQQFKNNSGGHIGVVVIGPDGHERGASVRPDDTVWLSEPEQILTANAPRRAEDNPFIEQVVIRRNLETDAEEEVKITPLVPISENRWVPAGDRPIPADLVKVGAQSEAISQDAASSPEPSLPDTGGAAVSRHEQVAAEGASAAPQPAPPQGPPPVPPRAAAAAQAADEPVSEEHAVKVNPDIAEETGAALPPVSDAPVGEYTAQEEVGTPDAPQAGPPPAPAPWSPGSTEQPGDAENKG